jgi:DNA-binding transcriptional MerR regulator
MNTFNPDQAAIVIGASASTIRNWCKVYAGELSKGANPPTGTERRLTQQDVAKLQQVKVSRDNRIGVDEIIKQLQAAANDNQVVPFTVDVAPTSHMAPQEGQGEALYLPTVITTLQGRMDAMERGISELTANRRQNVAMYVLGILSGVALVIVLFLAFERLGQ